MKGYNIQGSKYSTTRQSTIVSKLGLDIHFEENYDWDWTLYLDENGKYVHTIITIPQPFSNS